MLVILTEAFLQKYIRLNKNEEIVFQEKKVSMTCSNLRKYMLYVHQVINVSYRTCKLKDTVTYLVSFNEDNFPIEKKVLGSSMQ